MSDKKYIEKLYPRVPPSAPLLSETDADQSSAALRTDSEQITVASD